MKPDVRFSRRTMLAHLAGAAAMLATPRPRTARSADSERKTGMGLVIYDCAIRRRCLRQVEPAFDLFEPMTFLKHCHQLGAGGMQAALGVLDKAQVVQLRRFADQHNMFIDAIVAPPQDKQDCSRFDAEIRSASDVGALAARTVVMPGRRYEQFNSIEEVHEAAARARRMLELAAPVVQKYRLPLAVENHKDQRIDERVALFKQLDCEFIGACVDTGNSFALLDDPYQAVEALAPYAFTVHLKDQAVREYEQGFLLGDIPLGEGCFDLRRMVNILKRAKPKIHFALELITRDPLKVTCLTQKYWATMPEVPGGDLARTLRIVRQHPANNLQQVSQLPLQQQVELEDANIAASLDYASNILEL